MGRESYGAGPGDSNAVNRLTKYLNVNASRLLEEHQVKYENKSKHAGRRIRLTYMVVEAPVFEVIG